MTTHEKGEFGSGLDAAKEGLPESYNPHIYGTPEFDSWSDGWFVGTMQKQLGEVESAL